MLDTLRQLFDLTADEAPATSGVVLDKALAAAALMVHVIQADGVVRDAEEARLRSVLAEHYAVDAAEAERLAARAHAAQEAAIDLYGFTSLLKRSMSEAERVALVEDLWEMVYADGHLHEFEDNVVWRIAELVGVGSRERMAMKSRVLARRGD